MKISVLHQQEASCASPLYVTNSFFYKKKKNYIVPFPVCGLSSTYQCEHAQTYLISWLHEDIISDLAKGQPQVNDVILCAASLRQVADVDHAAGARFPLGKLRGTKTRGWSSNDISFLPSIPDAPNGYLPLSPNNDCKTKIYKINAEKESIRRHIWNIDFMPSLHRRFITFLTSNPIQTW